MPNYRRPWVQGATYFVTLVTNQRQKRFADAGTVALWRDALTSAIHRKPFKVLAGVVLPDHIHLMIELPKCDDNLSSRIGLAKAIFTRSLHAPLSANASRHKHREADIWQRRFFDHFIRNDDDFNAHLDYLHYNPVKHGYVRCPGDWPWTSFHIWIKRGAYAPNWGCGDDARRPNFKSIEHLTGE